jgi:predicted DNA binding CopG/RHH family protein
VAKKKLKEIPEFESEEQEREFWATHDSADYVDWSRAERATLANLKPSTKTISVRLPESLLDELKLLANKRDVPYQSLLNRRRGLSVPSSQNASIQTPYARSSGCFGRESRGR